MTCETAGARSGPAAGTHGFFHEAAFYASEEEFLRIVLPFVCDGLEAGEPTLVTLDERHASMVDSAVGSQLRDTDPLFFVSGGYPNAASALRLTRKLFADHLARGVTQIRLLGNLSQFGAGDQFWHSWSRFEAAINHLFRDLPVYSLCPYDRQSAPPNMLADVLRTHPYIVTTDGRHLTNGACQDPALFLAARLTTEGSVEAAPPAFTLTNPTAQTARRTVRDAALRSLLPASDINDLVIAVSEVVNNAWCHGEPPVRLRIWPHVDHMVVTVSDCGRGPTDPYTGLLPAPGSASGGLGLWLAHQVCRDVTLHRDGKGFTIRLIAGR